MSLTEQLAAVPRLANLGPLFKSSQSPTELTESETEYIVRCVKHTFPHHIVFQVHCSAVYRVAQNNYPRWQFDITRQPPRIVKFLDMVWRSFVHISGKLWSRDMSPYHTVVYWWIVAEMCAADCQNISVSLIIKFCVSPKFYEMFVYGFLSQLAELFI